MTIYGRSAAPAELDGFGLKIGIVMSRFNPEIGQVLLQNCQTELQRLGVAAADISVQQVAGALEIPLVLQALARTRQYDGLVAIGTVIRGDTYHFEIVCNETCAGVSRVQLDEHIPIANVVLTVNTQEQALARLDKGTEAAQVVVEMAQLLKSLA